MAVPSLNASPILMTMKFGEGEREIALHWCGMSLPGPCPQRVFAHALLDQMAQRWGVS